MDGTGDINVLPEGCLANVLSLTSPKDVCRLSAVSSGFRSAAEWDSVWERFLPAEYKSLISQSSDPSLLSRFQSKKQLFLSLSHNPILIDTQSKSFWLDKCGGKKCFMISARSLMIVWGDTPMYWRWTQGKGSRFGEVAELISVCWLEICGKISVSMLSPKTHYAAYLVFKTTATSFGFDYQAVEVSLGLDGTEASKQTVYLDVVRGQRPHVRTLALHGGFFYRSRHWISGGYAPTRERVEAERDEREDGQFPRKRDDGWFEIELGKFFNENGDSGDLAMSVLEVKGGDWKGGLIIQGIELRPKEANK